MAEDPFKAMNLSRREYLSKYGQSVIDSPNSNISDREDALVVKEGLANQRGREAQQQFYDVAPSAREAFLEDNAVISASPQFGQVQNYMGEARRGPTYSDNVLRKSIAVRVPAYLRGEFESRVDAGEGVNEVFADLEIKDEDRKLRLSGIQAGIAPEEMDKYRDPETGLHNEEAISYAISQRGKKDTSPVLKAMSDELEYQRSRMADAVKRNADLPPAPGDDPDYDDALQQVRTLGARMSAARSSIFNPPAEAVVDTSTDWAAADAAEVGLRGDPTQRAVNPAASNLGMLKAETDPVRIDSALRSGELSEEESQAAIDRLKELAGTPDETLTVKRDEEKRKAIAALAKEAEDRKTVDKVVREELNPAWDMAKAEMVKKVSEFAKKSGKSEQQIYNSIAAGEGLVDEPYMTAKEGGARVPPEYTVLGGPFADAESEHLKRATGRWYLENYKTAPIRSVVDTLLGYYLVPTNARVLKELALERRSSNIEAALPDDKEPILPGASKGPTNPATTPEDDEVRAKAAALVAKLKAEGKL